MTDSLNKDYAEGIAGVMEPFILAEDGKNERTRPLFCFNATTELAIYSLKSKAEYPLIGISNICEPVNTLCQFHYNIPAVSDYPCGNVEEAVS